jgi:hypothetical protein
MTKMPCPSLPIELRAVAAEGNKTDVQAQGKMPESEGRSSRRDRRCFFQPTTTSDGDNRSYEQQIPSSLRVCLSFRHFLHIRTASIKYHGIAPSVFVSVFSRISFDRTAKQGFPGLERKDLVKRGKVPLAETRGG